jgi:hypothetical protein
MKKQDAEPRSSLEVVRGPSKKEEDTKTKEEDYRDIAPPRRFRNQYQQQPDIDEEGFKTETPFRKYFTPRYHIIFLCSCYSCSNFGHKAVNCRANTKNKRNDKVYTINNYPRRSHEAKNKNYNRFGSLSDEMECYK